jgi:hypothetical protein
MTSWTRMTFSCGRDILTEVQLVMKQQRRNFEEV